MAAFNNLWPDPSKATSIEEFFKQYSEQYGRAMAFKELYNLLESADANAQATAKKIKEPEKDYAI